MNFATARIIELRSEVDAIMVRVEGMKAENQARARLDQAPAYVEDSFAPLSNEILALVVSMRRMSEQL